MSSNYERLRELRENDPEEFRRLILSLKKTTVVPHEGQQPVIESKARFKVLNCGRRWGKTVLAAKLAVQATRQPNKMVWWVAPTYRIAKRGYVEVLRQLPRDVLTHDPPPETNFDAGRPAVLRFKNGTRMEFYSSERPESMLGAAVDYVVLDEAARMSPLVWHQTISPTLIDHLGSGLIISTPRGRNWFYDVYLKGQDPQDTEWASWTFTTQDNPTLPPGEADRMAEGMPKLDADQEIFAKWLAAGSSVFYIAPEVVEDLRVLQNGLIEGRTDLRGGGGVFLGVDLARTSDYTVLYGEQESTRHNVYFERFNDLVWSEQRRRIRRAVKRVLDSGAEYVTLMVDEGNAGSVIVEDLEEAGYDVRGVNFTTHKANMVRLLATDLARGKALVLKMGVTELENYGMHQTPSGRMTYAAPEGQNDDVVSAKMLAHWGVVNEGYGDINEDAGAVVIREAEFDPEVDTTDEESYDDYSDLVDEAEELEMTPAEHRRAMEAIGLEDPSRMSPEELAARGWF